MLAAIALPAMAKVRRSARDLGCINNLREWGRATAIYTSDNQDRLPKDGSPNGLSKDEGWYVELPRILLLPPYADSSWRTNPAIQPGPSPWICPSNPRRSNGNNLFHYCLNEHVNGRGGGRRADVSNIRKPSSTVWLFDNGKLAAVAQQNNVHTNLHKGGAHFLFLDGHVSHYPNSSYWDFETNKGLTNHPDLRWIP